MGHMAPRSNAASAETTVHAANDGAVGLGGAHIAVALSREPIAPAGCACSKLTYAACMCAHVCVTVWVVEGGERVRANAFLLWPNLPTA